MRGTNLAARLVFVAAFVLPMQTSMAQHGDGVPAFQISAPNGETSILIGSLHIPYKHLKQPSPSLLDGAKHYVVEHFTTTTPLPKPKSIQEVLDVLAPGAFQSYLHGRKVRAAWAAYLTDAQVERFRKNISCDNPVPQESIDFILMLRSPQVAATLAYNRCSTEGLRSRDDILWQAAEKRGIPIVPLESEEAIMVRRNAIPDRIYEMQFRLALTEDVDERLAKVVESLNRGDFDAVAALSMMTLEGVDDAELFHRIKLRERNQEWMSPLRKYLDEGHAVILVGAAHLPGPDGLTAMLKEAGYIVERVTLPAIN
jgi:uncharacterized protein